MKCLQNKTTGEIIRISDDEADKRSNSVWQFVPKSEWKKSRPTVSVEYVKEMQEQADKKEVTVSEKLLKRKKLKEKQRPNE